MFTYPDGRPLRPDYISERFLTLSARLGLPRIRFHDLRHTHATIALQAGVPVHVVAQRLGHSNPTMTLSTYAHVIPAALTDAATTVADAIPTAANMPLRPLMFDTGLTQPTSTTPEDRAQAQILRFRKRLISTKEKPETQLEVFHTSSTRTVV